VSEEVTPRLTRPPGVSAREPRGLGGERSPLAIEAPLRLVPDDFDPTKRRGKARSRVRQYVVHMTGSGIVSKAIKAGRDVVSECLRYYAGNPTSSHYLIGYDGTIYWLTSELIRVGHVGVEASERRAYHSGAWARGIAVQTSRGLEGPVSTGAVDQWRRAWPGRESPMDLVLDGAGSINDLSVASEMPPAGVPRGGGRFDPLPGLELHAGTRHTRAQHEAVARLAADLAYRWAWPDDWRSRSSARVLGHEDVDLYGRADGVGGWDPGALRPTPRWNWGLALGLHHP